MNRTRLSAAAAGLLVVGLTFGATPAAHAKVKAKDAPSKGDIAKVFPAMKGATFTKDKSKVLSAPGKTCGTTTTVKAKSAFTTVGVAGTGEVAGVGVYEFKSKAQAGKALKKSKKQVKKCKSFTVQGVPATVKKFKTPKLGQDRLGAYVTTTITVGDTVIKGHAATVSIRHGKRLAVVQFADDAKIPTKKINKLAKVAAKKMK